MALLSIIVPVYNKIKYIDACIQSILSQSFKNFELILINDGSNDNSAEKCTHYAEVDKRVVVVHQENKGVSSARNEGLKIAKGNYIGFVDCDDTIDADMYEILMDNIIGYGADVSICGVTKTFPAKKEAYYGTNKIKVFNKTEVIAALLNKEFSRSVYDKIYKAELAKNIKFQGQMNEDTFYNFLLFNNTIKTVFYDVLKYNYIIRENSVSMEKFSVKYMDSIGVSKSILDICKDKTPELIDEAKRFHLITLISVYNLIVLSNRRRYQLEYQKTLNYLKAYPFHLKDKASGKHKYALLIIKFSPKTYNFLMTAYCRLNNADVANRT